MTSGTVQVQGCKLAYIREGKGPTIFVIGSSVYYQKAFSNQLREKFDLIFADSRHFVPSCAPPPDELMNLDVETFADDVDAIRRHLSIERMAVLGHSVHAQIALAYARKYPAHTSRLIIIGGLPYSRAECAGAQTRFWEEHASHERKQILSRNLIDLQARLAAAPQNRSFAIENHAYVPMIWADPEYNPDSLLEGLENGPALGRLFECIPSHAEVRRALEELSIPGLIILGQLDFLVPPTLWDELLEGLDQFKCVLLQDQGHCPQTECPEIFDKELMTWFQEKGDYGERSGAETSAAR
jgi:proline iminopeptidase